MAADITLRFIGLRQLGAELAGAGPDLRRQLRKELRRIGQVARRAWLSQFAGRLTDPNTRRRTESGGRLGRFTGRAARSIGIRTRITKDRMTIFVGPRGGAGIPKPGFYLAFHEFGTRRHPVRQTAAPADRMIRPSALRDLEYTLRKILRGW